MPELDTQQVEVVGRSLLIAQLTLDGLEVARPERDNGIDLLVFKAMPWRAIPVQLKVLSKPGWNIDRRYQEEPLLRIVHVWMDEPEPEFFVMSWEQAYSVLEALGSHNKPYWLAEGRWATTKATAKLRTKMQPHRVAPGVWEEKLGLA